MTFVLAIFLGLIISIGGIIIPGMLNMTIAKLSIKENQKQALNFAFGAVVVVFVQSFLGTYFAKFLDANPVFSEGLIKIVEQYIHKGQTLYVEGSLRTTKYTDAAGIEKYSTNVMVQGYGDTIRMVGGAKSGSGESFDNDSSSSKAISNEPSADMDDEIPF